MADTSRAAEPKTPRPRLRVMTLLVLVACCGSIFWAIRVVNEQSGDPTARWARELRIGNLDRRQVAAAELGGVASEGAAVATNALLVGLRDDDATVRESSAESLGRVVHRVGTAPSNRGFLAWSASSALVEAIGDHRPRVRLAMLSALSEAGMATSSMSRRPDVDRAVIASLSPMLDDPDPILRAGVAHALGCWWRWPDPLSPALVEALKDDVPMVRARAASALGHSREESGPAFEALVDLLRDPEVSVGSIAADGLSKVKHDSGRGFAALFAVVSRDEIAARERAAQVIGQVTQPPISTLPMLMAGLRDGDLMTKDVAASCLYRIGPEAHPALPGLIVELECLSKAIDRPPTLNRVVGSVASAIGRIAPMSDEADRSIVALIAALRAGLQGHDLQVIFALGAFGPKAEQAIPVLLDLLNDRVEHQGSVEDQQGRAVAALALVRIARGTKSAPKVVEALIASLDGKSTQRREQTIYTLSEFGRDAAPALPYMRRLMDSDVELDVRNAARNSHHSIEAALQSVDDDQ